MNISDIEHLFLQIENDKTKCLDDLKANVLPELRKRLSRKEFVITVIGEFSSGKSTLLNALIGKDVLPHSVSETTATLTYIHNVHKGDPKENKAFVTQMNGSQFEYDLDKLKDVVTTFSDIDVHQQIDYVDVYVNFLSFDTNVVFVDTPGLNGTSHLEDRTLTEVARADASINLYSLAGIKDSENRFMKEVLQKAQNSFFFVMNSIDEIKLSEETYDSKIESFAKDLSDKFYDGKIVPQNVLGVSALKALASQDCNIKRLHNDDEVDLTDEDRKRCWEESKFEQFTRQLKTYLQHEKEKVFVNNVLNILSESLARIVYEVDENIAVNQDKETVANVDGIQRTINEAKFRFDNFRKNLYGKINSAFDDLDTKVKNQYIKEVVQLGSEKVSQIKKVIEGINSIEAFNKEFGEDGSKLNNVVNSFFSRVYSEWATKLNKDIDAIDDMMYNDISKQIPNLSLQYANRTGLFISKENPNYSNISLNSLNEKTDRKNELMAQKESLERQEDANLNRMRQLSSQESSIRNTISNLESQRRSLGARPSVKKITKTETIERERSIFNPIRWFGFGHTRTYNETVTYEVTDSSERDEYDRKYQELQDKIEEKERDLNAIRNKKYEIPSLKAQIELVEKRIESETENIRREQASIEEKKRYRRTEFLKKRGEQLIDQLTSVIADSNSDSFKQLIKRVKEFLNNQRDCMNADISQYFNTESRRYIELLEDLVDNVKNSTNEKIAQKRNLLLKDKQVIENYINQTKNLIRK